jgi:hypothetical protein
MYGICAMGFVGACFDGVVGLGEFVVFVVFGAARHGAAAVVVVVDCCFEGRCVCVCVCVSLRCRLMTRY